ncbi:MAG: energy-coupling factor transporter ATPase [Sporolactobacillus sp.]
MDLTLEHVTHIYNPRTPYMREALKDVSLSIPSGSFTSIIGHTGSGKSTLAQHLNGLLLPSKGTVRAGELLIQAGEKKKNLKKLRQRVGFVFQYPEHQLFEETLLKDVSFGPINFGVPQAEAAHRAEESLKRVGIPESFWQRSPFDLSGGQMRRVAIAGVLAVEPEVIILDEPTAGLDPRGRREIMDLFVRLHREEHRTIVMVTHNMSDAACYSDQVLVMDHARLVMSGSPGKVFSEAERLRAIGLDSPETMLFVRDLADKLGIKDVEPVFTMDAAADAAASLLKGDAAHV